MRKSVLQKCKFQQNFTPIYHDNAQKCKNHLCNSHNDMVGIKIAYYLGINTRPQKRQTNKEGNDYGRKTQHGPDGPGVHGL